VTIDYPEICSPVLHYTYLAVGDVMMVFRRSNDFNPDLERHNVSQMADTGSQYA
jgi:hypothetical protein